MCKKNLNMKGKQVFLKFDPTHQNIEWEGWGTSLAWWANFIGTQNNIQLNEHIASLLFDPSNSDGLQMNIVRYNIGGGSNPSENEVLRPGGNVPGYKIKADGDYNWNADYGQMYFLRRAAFINPDVIVEVFSNSPPWFLTKSGKVSGNSNLFVSNVSSANVSQFAKYLVDVAEHLQKIDNIPVKYISPMNEPSSPTWTAGCGQEGCYWGPIVRRQMMACVKKEIYNRKLSLQVSGLEENNVAQGVLGLMGMSNVDKLNVHSYHLRQFTSINTFGIEDANIFRNFLSFFTKLTHRKLWMSEWGSGSTSNPQDIVNALNFGYHVINDLVNMRPSAWVYWQAIENFGSGGWGLIQQPFGNLSVSSLLYNRQFYGMAHFSRFIKKGTRIFNGQSHQKGISYVFASDPKKKNVVVVVVNNSIENQFLNISLNPYNKISNITLYETFANINIQSVVLTSTSFMCKAQSLNTVVIQYC